MRLKNLTLSYDLPKQWISKLALSMNKATLLSSSLQHKIWNIFIFVREQLPANHTGYTLQLFFTEHISVVFLIENHTGFH